MKSKTQMPNKNQENNFTFKHLSLICRPFGRSPEGRNFDLWALTFELKQFFMDSPNSKKNKSGKIKIILAALALFLFAFLIYWLFSGTGQPEDKVAQPEGQKSGLEQLEELLRQSQYRDLKKFGPWPMSFEPKGKSNPFLNTSPN